MQKLVNYIKNGGGALIFGTLCATAGAALFIPGTSPITTLPFILLFTAIPAFVVEKPYILPPLFFAVTYFFSFAKNSPLRFPHVLGGYTLYIAIFAALISLLTCLACAKIKNAVNSKGKRFVTIPLAVVLIVAGVLANSFIHGTPWAAHSAKSQIFKHIESSFEKSELDIGGVYYVQNGEYYACDVQIKGTGDSGSVIYKNGVVSHDLTKLAVGYAGADKATNIAKELRAAFPNDSFTVTPVCERFGNTKLSFKDSSKLLPFISYNVTVNSEETAKSFVEKAESYAAVLSRSDVACDNITITGGAKQKLYYTISVDVGAPQRSLASLLRIYSTFPLPQSSLINAHSALGQH